MKHLAKKPLKARLNTFKNLYHERSALLLERTKSNFAGS